jgi:hypothetical protein
MARGEIVKRSKDEILGAGAKSLDTLFDEYQALALILDISGSMASAVDYEADRYEDRKSKIDLQTEVCKDYLRSKLGGKVKTMKVSVIGYNGSTHRVVSDSSDINALERGLNGLRAGGDTILCPAMEQGLSLVLRSLDFIPRLVVTGDGMIHDPDSCIAFAERAKEHGVVIDTIYIGTNDYDDGAAFLRKLSEITGGVSERVGNAAEFKTKYLKVLDRRLITAGKPELHA